MKFVTVVYETFENSMQERDMVAFKFFFCK